jgi:hypothetical protein
MTHGVLEEKAFFRCFSLLNIGLMYFAEPLPGFRNARLQGVKCI